MDGRHEYKIGGDNEKISYQGISLILVDSDANFQSCDLISRTRSSYKTEMRFQWRMEPPLKPRSIGTIGVQVQWNTYTQFAYANILPSFN